MSIYRVGYGLIFEDGFDTFDTDRWRTVSPSNAVRLQGDNGTGILHMGTSRNGRSTVVMMDLPQDENELLFQVYADYTPALEGEGGGIVVWKNAMEKVEFLETVDTTRELTYSVWRAVKRNNLWAFYAQQSDGSWELFDSTICIDPTMLGLTLRDHVDRLAKPLRIDRVVLCRGTHIKVANISNGDKVVLKGADGVVVREATVPLNHSGVALELPTIPFNGTIEVHQLEEDKWKIISLTEEEVRMYGGDLFLKGTDLKIKWRDAYLNETTATHIGSLKNNRLRLPMVLCNTNEFDVAENVEIKVAQYLDHFGWKWVDVATDVNGSPGVFSDIIEMGTLDPLSEKTFWVNIEVKDRNDKDFLGQALRETNFYLEVVNS